MQFDRCERCPAGSRVRPGLFLIVGLAFSIGLGISAVAGVKLRTIDLEASAFVQVIGPIAFTTL